MGLCDGHCCIPGSLAFPEHIRPWHNHRAPLLTLCKIAIWAGAIWAGEASGAADLRSRPGRKGSSAGLTGGKPGLMADAGEQEAHSQGDPRSWKGCVLATAQVFKADLPLQSPSRCHQGIGQVNIQTVRGLIPAHHLVGSRSQQGTGLGTSWRLSVLWPMSTSRPCA